MNCNHVAEYTPGIISGELAPTRLADCEQHIKQCADCRDALRGAESLALLRDRDVPKAPAGLLQSIAAGFEQPAPVASRRSFWLGTGFGSAIAASLLALSLMLGWTGPIMEQDEGVAEFVVTMSEPRMMDIAIETDRALAGANISIMLSGGVELDGYGHRRELAWTTDLEAGVNRLSLPVMAVSPAGGRMVVRLQHPESEQVFVIQLKTEA